MAFGRKSAQSVPKAKGAGRFEYKHNITKADCYILRNQLKAVMKLDEHSGENGYIVRSVYFDNLENKHFNQKLYGIDHREKFRARMYGDNLDSLHMEKKSKKNKSCFKEACPLSIEEYNQICNGNIDFMRTDKRTLLRELYIHMTLYKLRPNNIVQYNREAYVYPYGNVRITLDSDIKTSITGTDLTDPNRFLRDTTDNSFVVLEVKYDEYLPDFIKGLIQIGNRRNTAISKYSLSRLFG